MPKTIKLDARTALRLPSKLREQIVQLVAEGKYRSLSHVVREALEKFLDDKN
ncbi:MAG: ribbon-helix-helix domain-containing protein [Candidatus Bathyarchaeia archaeon]